MSNREIVQRLRDYRDQLYLDALKYDADAPDVRLVSTVLEELDGVLEGEF